MVFTVRLHPGSKQEKIGERADGTLEVWVRAKPKENEANERLIELLAEHLDVPKSCITIIRGRHSRIKLITVATVQL